MDNGESLGRGVRWSGVSWYSSSDRGKTMKETHSANCIHKEIDSKVNQKRNRRFHCEETATFSDKSNGPRIGIVLGMGNTKVVFGEIRETFAVY